MPDPAAVVRAHYDAIRRRDLPGVLDTLAEDVAWEFDGPPEIPFAGCRRGREAVAAFFAAIRGSVEILEFGVERMMTEGDTVTVLGHEHFRVMATGRAWNVRWVQIFAVRDGRISGFREFTDTAAIQSAYAARPE